MLAEERRQSILNLIQSSGSARTGDLAKRFMVSDQTIRRDLQELEDKGLISKQHGGGVFLNYHGAAYQERSILRLNEKHQIAREAVLRIKQGMTVALGPGTTTHEIACLLNGMDIQVITNSLTVAHGLSKHPTKVQLTGGDYRPEGELLTGDWVLSNLNDCFADVSFLGVSGIGADAGYTVTKPDEAAVLRQFIRIARHSIIVTDSSKFHRIAPVSVAPLHAVHTLITDSGIPESVHQLLKASEVEVVTVDGTRPTAEDP